MHRKNICINLYLRSSSQQLCGFGSCIFFCELYRPIEIQGVDITVSAWDVDTAAELSGTNISFGPKIYMLSKQSCDFRPALLCVKMQLSPSKGFPRQSLVHFEVPVKQPSIPSLPC